MQSKYLALKTTPIANLQMHEGAVVQFWKGSHESLQLQELQDAFLKEEKATERHSGLPF